MENDIFKVSEELQKKLKAKYPLHVIAEYFYSTETRIVKVNSHEIRIISKIFEYSRIPKEKEEDVKAKFALLCEHLKEICNKYKIPYKTTDILLVSDKNDETLPRPLCHKFKLDDGIDRWLIYIPKFHFEFKTVCWFYNFLHELGHCWITIDFGLPEGEELFVDTVAISVLKTNFDWQNCKDDIEKVSYLGEMIRKKKRPFYTPDILDNPERSLVLIFKESTS